MHRISVVKSMSFWSSNIRLSFVLLGLKKIVKFDFMVKIG